MRLGRLLLALLTVLPAPAAAQPRAARIVVPRAGAVTPVTPVVLGPATLAAPLSGAVARPDLTPTLATRVPAPQAPRFAAPADSPRALSAAPPAAPAPVAAAADAPELPGLPGLSGADEDAGDPRRPESAAALLRRLALPSADRAAALLAKAFDGSGRALTEEGALFEIQADLARPGQVRIVRLAPAPAAAPLSVPGTEGLSGRALLEALGRVTRQGQRQFEYNEASNYLFSVADNVVIGGVRGVVDAYSGVFVAGTSTEGRDYPEPGDRNRDGHVDEGMNVEHVWPQGHFDKRLPMRSDLHHLMATFIHPNGVRGNVPFGVVRGRPTYSNDAGTKGDGRVFEPADFSKGRVARAMLYFYARYRGEAILSNGGPRWWDQQIETLLDWNRRFPPDAEERARNDRVERFQGNRNPFVDDHTLADRVGAETWRPPSRSSRLKAFLTRRLPFIAHRN
ncbi:MAG: endonuclease [Elusimicrobiota bacterium]|nr:endonuclease [Elusimicrobiota bacterium]